MRAPRLAAALALVVAVGSCGPDAPAARNAISVEQDARRADPMSLEAATCTLLALRWARSSAYGEEFWMLTHLREDAEARERRGERYEEAALARTRALRILEALYGETSEKLVPCPLGLVLDWIGVGDDDEALGDMVRVWSILGRDPDTVLPGEPAAVRVRGLLQLMRRGPHGEAATETLTQVDALVRQRRT